MGSSIGVLGVIIGVAIVILRGRGENGLSNDFNQQLWNEGGNQSLQPMIQPDLMAQTALPAYSATACTSDSTCSNS